MDMQLSSKVAGDLLPYNSEVGEYFGLVDSAASILATPVHSHQEHGHESRRTVCTDTEVVLYEMFLCH